MPIEVGVLVLDPPGYRATLRGEDLSLSPSQLELLAYLLKNRDRVVSRDELAAAARLDRGRSVDVALSNIRRTLGGGAIRNVRNRGWIFEPKGIEA